MEKDIALLMGIPVADFPDYPDLSPTKTEWEKIQCHHCRELIWLGEKQRALLAVISDSIMTVPVCPRCGVVHYGITKQTPMSPLTHERKDVN